MLNLEVRDPQTIDCDELDCDELNVNNDICGISEEEILLMIGLEKIVSQEDKVKRASLDLGQVR